MKLFDKKNQCCGCTACMNICPQKAIEMVEDEEGFKYPKINEEKCIDCGLCKKICAFQMGYNVKDKLNNSVIYAAKSKSDETRLKSSSGGMFAEISNFVLENKGVIYGVAFDKNFKAVHIRADNEAERDRCIGSKYSQSDLDNIFCKVKEDLQTNRLVLFTGTPCQIGALNTFLRNVNKDNLILVDIVCHGVPSPKLFNEYIKFCEKKNKSSIIGYYHRAKDNGWRHTEKAIYKSGKIDYNTLLSQAWKRIFYSDYALRPSCYSCKYCNMDRPSDITIADFWGIEKFNPEFADDKGVSLIIINTQRGKEVFEGINNKLECIEKNIVEAQEKNPQLKVARKIDLSKRLIFWKQYEKGGFEIIIKKYGKYNYISKIKRIIKKILKNMIIR